MEYHEIIIGRIAALCRQRGLSYNRLAGMSGLRQSTVDNIMRGVSKNPRVKTLHKLAYAFNMTLSEFLDFPEMNEAVFDEGEDGEESLY